MELLTPDFLGVEEQALATVLGARPEVFSHNIETVRRLHRSMRGAKASYDGALRLLRRAKEVADYPVLTKTGIIAGLGETNDEIVETMRELRAHGVDVVTIGQYLQPSAKHVADRPLGPPRRVPLAPRAGRGARLRLGLRRPARALELPRRRAEARGRHRPRRRRLLRLSRALAERRRECSGCERPECLRLRPVALPTGDRCERRDGTRGRAGSSARSHLDSGAEDDEREPAAERRAGSASRSMAPLSVPVPLAAVPPAACPNAAAAHPMPALGAPVCPVCDCRRRLRDDYRRRATERRGPPGGGPSLTQVRTPLRGDRERLHHLVVPGVTSTSWWRPTGTCPASWRDVEGDRHGATGAGGAVLTDHSLPLAGRRDVLAARAVTVLGAPVQAGVRIAGAGVAGVRPDAVRVRDLLARRARAGRAASDPEPDLERVRRRVAEVLDAAAQSTTIQRVGRRRSACRSGSRRRRGRVEVAPERSDHVVRPGRVREVCGVNTMSALVPPPITT